MSLSWPSSLSPLINGLCVLAHIWRHYTNNIHYLHNTVVRTSHLATYRQFWWVTFRHLLVILCWTITSILSFIKNLCKEHDHFSHFIFTYSRSTDCLIRNRQTCTFYSKSHWYSLSLSFPFCSDIFSPPVLCQSSLFLHPSEYHYVQGPGLGPYAM